MLSRRIRYFTRGIIRRAQSFSSFTSHGYTRIDDRERSFDAFLAKHQNTSLTFSILIFSVNAFYFSITAALAFLLLISWSNIGSNYPDIILSQHIALLPLATGLVLEKFNCSNQTSFQKYVNNINSLLNEYRPKIAINKSLEEIEKSYKERKFDLSLLGKCSDRGLYGFDAAQPCFYISIGRIMNYIPRVSDGLMIKISCIQRSGNDSISLELWPKGILTKHLPYKPYETGVHPLVAFKLDAITPSSVHCKIDDPNISTFIDINNSDSYGYVEITVEGSFERKCLSRMT